MSLFSNKIELEIIDDLVEIVKDLVHQKRDHHCRNHIPRKKPLLVLTTKNNIIMNTTLTLGTASQSNLILVDNVTLQTVPATFTGQTVSSDSPTATFVFDTVDPTLVVATPVSVGGGNILLSTTATYVDSTGVTVTNSFTASYPFTVVATADGLTLSLTDFVKRP